MRATDYAFMPWRKSEVAGMLQGLPTAAVFLIAAETRNVNELCMTELQRRLAAVEEQPMQ